MHLTQPLKYEFAPLSDGDPEAPERAAPAVGKPRSWNEEQVEAIRAAAFADGTAKARAAAVQDAAVKKARALETIAAALASLDRKFTGEFAAIERGAAELAARIGSAIADKALNDAPYQVLRPLLGEALARLADETRITVTVHASMVAPIQADLSDLMAETGFAGRVRVMGGADHAADCRIDWADGGLERSLATIKREIIERLAQHGVAIDGPTAVEES